MKKTDLKSIDKAELIKSIETKKMELMKLKVSNKVSQIENPIQLRSLRKEIARYATELSRKQIQEI